MNLKSQFSTEISEFTLFTQKIPNDDDIGSSACNLIDCQLKVNKQIMKQQNRTHAIANCCSA